MAKVSLEKDKIKFLLVEGVHQKALESLRAAGYTNIEFHKGALDTEELKASIRDAHFIGLRSRTQLTEDVIAAAEKLDPQFPFQLHQLPGQGGLGQMEQSGGLCDVLLPSHSQKIS